jgi:hypothetical protein
MEEQDKVMVGGTYLGATEVICVINKLKIATRYTIRVTQLEIKSQKFA